MFLQVLINDVYYTLLTDLLLHQRNNDQQYSLEKRYVPLVTWSTNQVTYLFEIMMHWSLAIYVTLLQFAFCGKLRLVFSVLFIPQDSSIH